VTADTLCTMLGFAWNWAAMGPLHSAHIYGCIGTMVTTNLLHLCICCWHWICLQIYALSSFDAAFLI